MEEYGRGVDIVFNKMEDWDLSPPLFRNSVNRFEAILLGPKYRQINQRQMKIIDYLLLKKELTIKDCIKIFKHVPRATLSVDLKKLKLLGLILQKGSSSNAYYVMGI